MKSSTIWMPFIACLAVATANARPLLQRIELHHGSVISENIFAEDIFIPHGADVRISAEIQLSASNSIVVLGRLKVDDAESAGHPNAPGLTMIAGRIMTIHGSVIGGNGWCHGNTPPHLVGPMPGGDGTAVTLSAPDILLTGLVAAGNGGNGGPSAIGGAGGALHQTGRHITNLHVAPPIPIPEGVAYVVARGGNAGHGGPAFGAWKNGGSGGVSGDVYSELHPDDFSLSSTAPEPSAPGGGCVAGANGATTTKIREGGAPGHGQDGGQGTILSPAGGNGGHGTASGSVTAADAQDGTKATSCCNPTRPGKNGGNGGKGGALKTLPGGTGGKGGDAYRVSEADPYLAKGGNAGNSGKSGDCNLKKGGKAGDGGDGQSPGSAGTPGAESPYTIGAPGTYKGPGAGNPVGDAGTQGGTGSANGGGAGALGVPGNPCDT